MPCENCQASDIALQIMRARVSELTDQVDRLKGLSAEPFDKRAYQRELMRKRRAQAKKATS